MGEFDAIRPYDDSEVPAVLARLLSDKAFLDILTHFRFPRFAGALGWMLKPLIAHRLRREFAGVSSVATLQDKVEFYVDHTIERATDGVTYTGVEQFKSGSAYLFLANHRDIVMDPAFVSYAVYPQACRPRARHWRQPAQKPFVSDLMRLNKSHRAPLDQRTPGNGDLSIVVGVHQPFDPQRLRLDLIARPKAAPGTVTPYRIGDPQDIPHEPQGRPFGEVIQSLN